MSSAPDSPIEVVVEDFGVDAVLFDDGNTPTRLLLRPHQTFSNAVRAVGQVMPGMHPDAIRRLVRANLPSAPDLIEAPLDGRDGQVPDPARPRRGWPVALAAAVLCSVTALGLLLAVALRGPDGKAPDGWAGVAERVARVPSSPVLTSLQTHGWSCKQLSPLTFECKSGSEPTNVTATVGDAFTSYSARPSDTDSFTVLEFPSSDAARGWVQQATADRLLSHWVAVGEFAVTGRGGLNSSMQAWLETWHAQTYQK